jgi:hypothetical protein
MYTDIPVVENKILNNYNKTPATEKQKLETLLNSVFELD